MINLLLSDHAPFCHVAHVRRGLLAHIGNLYEFPMCASLSKKRFYDTFLPVMTFELTSKNRDAKADLAALRSEGLVPAVYYGAGKESTPITVNYVEFVKVFREAGESSMITLKTDNGEEQVIVQDIQQDPVKGNVLHVDFKVIEAGKLMEVTIPLEFVGESPAVKNGLGSLTKALQEIEIEVLPQDLPHGLEVDISVLTDLDAVIHAKDIKLPAGTLLTDPEAVVALVSAAREETEEETATEIDFSAIEVQKKGKAEEAETE